MPETVEEIKVRLTFEIQQALTESEKIKKSVDAMKAQLQEIVKRNREVGGSYKDLVREIDVVIEAEKRLQRESAKVEVKSKDPNKESKFVLTPEAREALSQYNKELDMARKQVLEFVKAEDQASKQTSAFAKVIQSLGTVAKYVFGAIFGVSIVSMLRNAGRWMSEAADKAIEFQRSLYLMEIGIRGLQKAGFDTTIQEWYDEINRFKEVFPILSEQEIVAGFSVAILKLRQYGAEQKQINRILEISAELAVAYGRDFGEMVNSVSGALTRGYFEALQNMGIAIGRINIFQEARKMGFTGAFTGLTEQQRFQIGLKVLEDNLKDIEDDIQGVGQEGEAAFIRLRKAEADVIDSTRELGEAWVEGKIAFAELKADALEFLSAIPEGIENLIKGLTLAAQKFSLIFQTYIHAVKGSLGLESDEEALKNINEISEAISELDKQLVKVEIEGYFQALQRISDPEQFKATLKYIEESLSPRWKEILGVDEYEAVLKEIRRITRERDQILSDFSGPRSAALQYVRDMEEALSQLENIAPDLQESYAEYQEDLLRSERDHNEKIIDIRNDLNDKLLDIDANFREKSLDAERSYLQKVEDVNRDYANRVAAAYRKYNRGVADAQRDYRQAELNAERDFQKEMRRLREDYLMDLEGALRERNALQVIQLSRQYEVDKRRREEDFQDEKDDRKREYEQRLEDLRTALQDELAEAARARDERLAQLAEELQARLAALAEEREAEKEEARQKWLERVAEEDARWEEEKKKIDERFKDRVAQLIEQLDVLKGLTDEELEYLRTALGGFWGDVIVDAANASAEIATAVNGIVTSLATAISLLLLYKGLQQTIKAYPGIPPGSFPRGSTPLPPSFAKGGTFIATKPTTIEVGEAGDEFVSIIPMNKLSTNVEGLNSGLPNGVFNSGSKAMNGRLAIELFLSSGLEGKIVDQALNDAADVFLDIIRSRV